MDAKTLKRILKYLKGKVVTDLNDDKYTILCVASDGFQKDCDTGMDRWLLSLYVKTEEGDREVWDFPLSNQLKKMLETEDIPIEFYKLDYKFGAEFYNWGIRDKNLGEQFLEKL